MTEPQRINLLVVEDDQSLREGICDLLGLSLFTYPTEIRAAENGVAALQVLEEFSPDLIISDIMMPKMNGLELLKSVRNSSRFALIPFVFLTAKGTENDVFLGQISGADLYITKPFESKELIELVQLQLNRAWEKRAANERSMSSVKRGILQLLNHEFRTPLTYITAYSEMLQEVINQESEIKNLDHYIDGIQAGCNRLINLIEDMVLVMDIHSGRIFDLFNEDLQTVCNLNEIIAQAVANYGEYATNTNVSIDIQIEQQLAAIEGNPTLLLVLFKHLVENAIKFTAYDVTEKAGNKVKITGQNSEETVQITVKDMGIGVSQTAHQKIFDLFYQHQREIYEQQGSGSGLPIVKGIVDAHYGQLDIESEPGQGFTAHLKFPRTSYLMDNPNEKLRGGKRKVTVLIVSQDDGLTKKLEQLSALSKRPYEVEFLHTDNNESGLEMLRKNIPDLIIAELNLPEHDGTALLEKIRKNDNLIHIPFIILASQPTSNETKRGKFSGAEIYLTKPYKTDNLLQLIYAQLKRHFEQMEAFSRQLSEFKRKILKFLQPNFRDPLDIVSMHSSELVSYLEGIHNKDELRDTLEQMQTNSQKISIFIEDFMAMAELQTGEIEKAFESRAEPCLDIVPLIKEASEEVPFHSVPIIVKEEQPHQAVTVKIEHSNLKKGFSKLFEVANHFCHQIEGSQIGVMLKGQENGDLQIAVGFGGSKQRYLTQEQEINSYFKTSFDELEINEEDEYALKLRIVAGVLAVHGGHIQFRGLPSSRGGGENIAFVINLPHTTENQLQESGKTTPPPSMDRMFLTN